jgi:hypothetical protein
VLRTRPPLGIVRKLCPVRLACVRHAASVCPEPGSNSPSKLCTQLHNGTWATCACLFWSQRLSQRIWNDGILRCRSARATRRCRQMTRRVVSRCLLLLTLQLFRCLAARFSPALAPCARRKVEVNTCAIRCQASLPRISLLQTRLPQTSCLIGLLVLNAAPITVCLV